MLRCRRGTDYRRFVGVETRSNKTANLREEINENDQLDIPRFEWSQIVQIVDDCSTVERFRLSSPEGYLKSLELEVRGLQQVS